MTAAEVNRLHRAVYGEEADDAPDTKRTTDVLTREQRRYNVYAFGCDIKRYTERLLSARVPHVKALWAKKLMEAQYFQATNQYALETLHQGA